MRKTTLIFAALGLLASGTAPALADQMPPGMKDLPAHKHPAKPKPKHSAGHQHRSAGQTGGHKMSGGHMMSGGSMMQGGHMMQGGQMPMTAPTTSPAPKKSGGGCC
jgi:hypothetical protein